MKKILIYIVIIMVVGVVSVNTSIFSGSEYIKIGDFNRETLDVKTIKGLQNLIKSTTWTFEGFGRNITFEFDSNSVFKRNMFIPADGISGIQTGHYEILSAKYSDTKKQFYYIDMTCEKSVVTSGAAFSCDDHYYLLPDSTLRLYDPSQESGLRTYSDESTSFKAMDNRGEIIRIEIKENKEITGYKLTNGILLYPNVLDFFPNKSNE